MCGAAVKCGEDAAAEHMVVGSCVRDRVVIPYRERAWGTLARGTVSLPGRIFAALHGQSARRSLALARWPRRRRGRGRGRDERARVWHA